MVHKYPPTIDEMKGRREKVPASEIKFFELVDDLNDEWYVWHSIRWDKKRGTKFGEADFLIFNSSYGFLVIEVKGGIISVENNCFYSTSTLTGEKKSLTIDPFDQAEDSMHHIRRFYIQRAKKNSNPYDYLTVQDQFPLNFNFGVFFPDSNFKDNYGYLQYSFDKVFDNSDRVEHAKWQGGNKSNPSPLETFFITLWDRFQYLREIKPKVKGFFIEMVGSNISRYVNLEQYYKIRENELDQVNQIQDYLLDAISEKNRCIFQGSAGSGKTFIAMKKALKNYYSKINTLFLCFNSELRFSIQNYISKKIGVPYDKIKGIIDVYSIHQFLGRLLSVMFDSDTQRRLSKDLTDFNYENIADKIREQSTRIPISLSYDAILVDEAQDIDSCLWDVIECFLKDRKTSLFYVFYDGAQAIFLVDFSPEHFGMDRKKDLIVLNRNLRNTVEIAKWLKWKTSYGEYKEFSGINGFKISSYNFPTAEDAMLQTLAIINKEYYDKEITPENIVILSNYKLRTLSWDFKNLNLQDHELCHYFTKVDKRSTRKLIVAEPNTISLMSDIKEHKEIDCEWCTMFKTIGSFKGLESDILFLIVPNLEGFKRDHPDQFDKFLMQVYVGASRAKFKLYFFEYDYHPQKY